MARAELRPRGRRQVTPVGAWLAATLALGVATGLLLGATGRRAGRPRIRRNPQEINGSSRLTGEGSIEEGRTCTEAAERQGERDVLR